MVVKSVKRGIWRGLLSHHDLSQIYSNTALFLTRLGDNPLRPLPTEPPRVLLSRFHLQAAVVSPRWRRD